MSADEVLLVHNYRLCNPELQDTLLYFSGELVKQATPAPKGQYENVFLLTGRKTGTDP